MDIRRREWQAEALEAIDAGLRAKLPGLRHPRDPVGVMKKSIASKFGLKKILVSGGGGDNMMAAIGTGNVASGACTLSLGTSGTIYAFFDKPFSDPQGEIAAFCDSTGGWLPLLCTMNATGPTEFMKDLFKLDNAALEILAAQAPAGSAGLLFLPFVDGERVPALPEASGTFFGLNRRNFDPSHMARSVMEGTILNLGYGFGRMRKLGLNPTAIRATGGGAKNRLWLQIVADILKTPVATLHENEAAAFGAAIQSIWTYWREKGQEIKIKDLTDQMVKIETPALEPNPRNFAIYDALQERFNSLWKTLKEEFKAHKKLLEKL
jgi:xylulokinase